MSFFGAGKNPYGGAGAILNQFNRNNLNPYINNGMWGNNSYKDLLSKLMGKTPVGFENSIMSQYKESPWAQRQIGDMTAGSNRAAAAGGYLGTPQEQEGLNNNIQGVVSTDQQQFYNNAVNPYEQHMQDALSGLSNLGSQGMSAQNMLEHYLETLANNKAAETGWGNQNTGIGGVMGGLGGLVGVGAGVAGMGGKNGFGWWGK